MQFVEELCDALARDALDLATRTGDDSIIDKLEETLLASSTVAQETFMTAVRVRRAEARARKQLAQLEAQARASLAKPK